MVDEMEYYIKFPTPTAKDSSSEENDDFVFVYDDNDKLPVVMLLGWIGCQDKYLSKYSAIYEERGCITVRYTAPVDCILFRRAQLHKLGVRLLDLIADMSLEDHPIFFHVFSNGGAFLYQHITQALHTHKKNINVKGVIFDSAPGERRLVSFYRAISAIIGGPTLYNVPVSLVLSAVLAFYWLCEVIVHSLREGKPFNTDPIALAEEPFDWPQLFLYSSSDQLIRATDVEKFAERRRERGVAVTVVHFPDSPHVKHFSTHPDLYVSTVCTFLLSCLDGGRVPNLSLPSGDKSLPSDRSLPIGVKSLPSGDKSLPSDRSLPIGVKSLPSGDKSLPSGDQSLPVEDNEMSSDRSLPSGDKALTSDSSLPIGVKAPAVIDKSLLLSRESDDDQAGGDVGRPHVD